MAKNIITTYRIPTDPDYYDNVTEEQALSMAEIISQRVREKYPEVTVELVPEVFSWNNRSMGDETIVNEIEGFVEDNWTDWATSIGL